MKLRRGAASIIVESQRLFTPVIITCEPSTLTKGQKWFDIPHRKMHYSITVGEKFNPQPLIAKGENLSKSNRRINETILELFISGIQRHERSG